MIALLAWLVLGVDADDWQKLEAIHLKNTRPVTKDFVRAGEGYFSPDAKQDRTLRAVLLDGSDRWRSLLLGAPPLFA